MSELKRTSPQEATKSQKERANRLLEYLAAKQYLELEDKDKRIALPYNELVVLADVNKASLYQQAYPTEINTYAGAFYEGGRGSKSIIEIKPETFLRNRNDALEDVEEIAEQEMEEYVFR